MNYYERHIGDYLKDTAHLSLLEHGVYTRLLDVYYTREAPLPAADVARLIGARTREEKAALQVVLAEFFQLDGDAYRQPRADREIARFSDGEPEREVKKANEENRLKRHRMERAALFKALTDAGQHAPWNIGMQDLRALVKALPGQSATAPETPAPPLPATAPATPATATQTPVPNTQTPDKEKYTVADATGAGAPPAPADVIFGLGIPLLTAASVAEKNARSMLGLMRKTHGDDALIAALRRCAQEQPLQPVAWLQAALKAHTPNGKATKREAEVAKWLGPLAKQSEIIDMEPANGPRAALG